MNNTDEKLKEKRVRIPGLFRLTYAFPTLIGEVHAIPPLLGQGDSQMCYRGWKAVCPSAREASLASHTCWPAHASEFLLLLGSEEVRQEASENSS